MRREFVIDGLTYAAYMDEDTGRFWFDLISGTTAKGQVWDRVQTLENLFFDEEPNFNDVNLNQYGLPVLLKVQEILLDFVYTLKPWRFSFGAATKRKIEIYRWATQKLMKKLPGYWMCEYPEGKFSFYSYGQTDKLLDTKPDNGPCAE